MEIILHGLVFYVKISVQDKDDQTKFHALPYELTHPLVKLATLHLKEYMNARSQSYLLEEQDPDSKKAKDAKKLVKQMSKAERFAVLNRRTAWIATQEWMAKNITVKDGKPFLKNASSKIKLWIVTVRVEINRDIAKLWLQPAQGKPFREVRCVSLEDDTVKCEFAQLVHGYGHVLDDDDTFQHCQKI